METNATVHIVLTNEDAGHWFSEWSEPVESTKGLFRTLQREFGRCKSRVYIDTKHGTKAIGWYFESRQQYEDCDETYIRGAWVTVTPSA